MKNQQNDSNSFLDPEHILHYAGVIVGQTVADIGCGGGYFVFPAARLVGERGRVYGVDILKSALSSLASQARMYGLSNVVPVWSDAEVKNGARAIPNGTVDYTFLVQLFSQTKDHASVLDEAARITKKDGHLVVVDWKSDKLAISPQKKYHVLPETIKQLAGQHGFKLAKEFSAGAYHYGLIFQKPK